MRDKRKVRKKLWALSKQMLIFYHDLRRIFYHDPRSDFWLNSVHEILHKWIDKMGKITNNKHSTAQDLPLCFVKHDSQSFAWTTSLDFPRNPMTHHKTLNSEMRRPRKKAWEIFPRSHAQKLTEMPLKSFPSSNLAWWFSPDLASQRRADYVWRHVSFSQLGKHFWHLVNWHRGSCSTS